MLLTKINQFISARLSNISWRNKILILCLFFSSCLVVLALASGYFVINEAKELKQLTEVTNKKVAVVNKVSQTVISMSRDQAHLILASERSETRAAAIQAIKSSSDLDQALHELETVLPKNPLVTRLMELRNQIKPIQLQIVKAARNNNDTVALDTSKPIEQLVFEIEALAFAIVNEQQVLLSETLLQKEKATLQKLFTFGIAILVFIALAILLGVYASVLVTKPMRMLEASMQKLSEGDLQIESPAVIGRDEVGKMVKATFHTVKTLHEIVCNISEESNVVTKEAGSVNSTAMGIRHETDSLCSNIEGIKNDADRMNQTTHSAMQQLGEAASKAEDTANTAQNATSKLSNTTQRFEDFQNTIEHTANVTQELSATA